MEKGINKMSIKTPKKLFLTTMVLFILVMSLGVTVVYGASPDFSTAKMRYNGTYSEIHNSSANAGAEVYLIFCYNESELNVTTTFDSGLYIDWDIYIHNSTESKRSESTDLPYSLGSNNCTVICNYTGYYYAVIRNNDSSVSHAFTLIISGSINAPQTPLIPGFEFIFLILGIVMALGLSGVNIPFEINGIGDVFLIGASPAIILIIAGIFDILKSKTSL